mmetsp:Transcript_1331/g.2200  ORF Transcript_1331/g.2200 Transcript_1331/m.2200 type:complete len:105 (+) Transcript_1331:683-997(+)
MAPISKKGCLEMYDAIRYDTLYGEAPSAVVAELGMVTSNPNHSTHATTARGGEYVVHRTADYCCHNPQYVQIVCTLSPWWWCWYPRGRVALFTFKCIRGMLQWY